MSNSETDLVQCETCYRWFTFFELVETIEEYLCEYCASGMPHPDDPEWEIEDE